MTTRRTFIAGLGGVVTFAGAANAQQPAMPVIGYLNGVSAAQFPHLLAAFRKGLSETGYDEGRNVAIEFRYADGQYDRLPALAAELVDRQIAVLVATAGTVTIRAAKAATSSIPIVFVIGSDPVAFGLVASLNRPGGNISGVTFIVAEIVAKRLGLLLELVPTARAIGVLTNPVSPFTAPQLAELQPAARTLGRQLHILHASTEKDFKPAFAAAVQHGIGALLVAADPFLDDRRAQLVALAARHKIPACYVRREFVVEGGLLSYGPDVLDGFRQAGIQTGRILKGAKPADLPVMQPTRFELLINAKTANALGLTIPPALLAFATEVLE
jgi:putative tryptophan/tyrosine transport system substrate-binding protein